jgi:predicted porin
MRRDSKGWMAAFAVAMLSTATAGWAQNNNVQIYGRANVGLDHYTATGSSVANADRKGRTRVFDQGSRIGFRGTEDLGAGLKAIFQIESGVNIDSGTFNGQNGAQNTNTGFLASRDSYGGFDSNFGRLIFGRFSIYEPSIITRFQSQYVNTQVTWTSINGFGRVASAPARTPNTMQYTTPTFGGVNVSLSYAPQSEDAQAGVNTNAYTFVTTARGNFGPVIAQADYAKVEGSSSTTPRVERDYAKLAVGWQYMPGSMIAVVGYGSQVNNATGLTAGDEVTQNAWLLQWEHTFGSVQALAQFGQMTDVNDCDTDAAAGNISCTDSGATSWMVGARYFLSKRTWVYLTWNQTENERNAFTDYTSGTMTSVTGAPTPYGADPRIVAFGVFHAF